MKRLSLLTLILFTALGMWQCKTEKPQKPWSVRMAESEITRNPQAGFLDFGSGALKWNYTQGLELLSFIDVYERYGDKRFWDYAVKYADEIVGSNGEIGTYSLSNYNIDHVCPGRILFRIYDSTNDPKYRMALDTLRSQLTTHPRTTDGGFWHKQIYPSQMWLDGLYMGQPFYAEYAKRYESGEQQQATFEDVVHQFLTVAKHTYDPQTKLYRHAWDESRSQFWADAETGQSEHAWGRAVGWYVTGIVDALEYIPAETAGRDKLIAVLQGIYETLPAYADPKTGMWYQVLDRPGAPGNYIEATCSAMFVYSMLKGIRMGYLDSALLPQAKDNYNKLIETFIIENSDGTISLTSCCAVAGLGGKDMRSGKYDYYLSEPVRDNDPKGVGPFIWASLEMERLGDR